MVMCVRRARLAGLTWPLPEGMEYEGLELLLFPAPTAVSQSDRRAAPTGFMWRRKSPPRRDRLAVVAPPIPTGLAICFARSSRAWKKVLPEHASDPLRWREGVRRLRRRHHRYFRSHHRRNAHEAVRRGDGGGCNPLQRLMRDRWRAALVDLDKSATLQQKVSVAEPPSRCGSASCL
jgi:hypothetical protein